jgi:ATP-dependent Lon protease
MNYFYAKIKAAVCDILRAKSLTELKIKSKILEKLLKKADDLEEPTAHYLRVKAKILACYFAYLALNGRTNEMLQLMEEKIRLFMYLPNHVDYLLKYIIKIFNEEIEKENHTSFIEIEIENIQDELFNDIIKIIRFLSFRDKWNARNYVRQISKKYGKTLKKLLYEIVKAQNIDELKVAFFKLFCFYILSA